MIEVTDFSKVYKSRKGDGDFSVEGINISVPDGEITGILGANGSGKSTIMKAVCAFHFGQKGKILITDRENKKINLLLEPEKAMENIGYVPETPVLPLEFTVYNFLIYAAKVHNMSQKQMNDSIRRLIKSLKLEDCLNKKIHTLSKGYRQRVSFAQALIHNPKNLILDEFTSGLDPEQIVFMRKFIQELSADKAILMSTHILQEAQQLCKNLYILKNGKIAASGLISEITQKSGQVNFETAYLKITEAANESL